MRFPTALLLLVAGAAFAAAETAPACLVPKNCVVDPRIPEVDLLGNPVLDDHGHQVYLPVNEFRCKKAESRMVEGDAETRGRVASAKLCGRVQVKQPGGGFLVTNEECGPALPGEACKVTPPLP